MVIQRLEVFMRTRIIVHAALLSLGLALPAWASPRILPPPPAPDMEMPLKNESRQKPVMPPAPPRGQMLYENHCMSCHESVVHIRTQKDVKSLPQLRTKVLNWADYLKLRWGKEEVEDVVIHLNSQYYKFELR
jgi:cytochrome c5